MYEMYGISLTEQEFKLLESLVNDFARGELDTRLLDEKDRPVMRSLCDKGLISATFSGELVIFTGDEITSDGRSFCKDWYKKQEMLAAQRAHDEDFQQQLLEDRKKFDIALQEDRKAFDERLTKQRTEFDERMNKDRKEFDERLSSDRAKLDERLATERLEFDKHMAQMRKDFDRRMAWVSVIATIIAAVLGSLLTLFVTCVRSSGF